MSKIRAAEQELLSRHSLKAAIWYTVSKIVEQEELSHNNQFRQLIPTASEQFIASLTELVFQQSLNLGKDLEHFAKHSNKRSTINVDDIKLVLRNNEALHQVLMTYAAKEGLILGGGGGGGGGGKPGGIETSPRSTKSTLPSKSSKGKTMKAKVNSKVPPKPSKGKGKKIASDPIGVDEEEDSDSSQGAFDDSDTDKEECDEDEPRLKKIRLNEHHPVGPRPRKPAAPSKKQRTKITKVLDSSSTDYD